VSSTYSVGDSTANWTYLEEVQSYLDQMSAIVTDSQREVEREKTQHEACRKALHSERQHGLELVQVLSSIKSQFELLSDKGIKIRAVPGHQRRDYSQRRYRTIQSQPHRQGGSQCVASSPTPRLQLKIQDNEWGSGESSAPHLPAISECDSAPHTMTTLPPLNMTGLRHNWPQQQPQDQDIQGIGQCPLGGQ
jgi:hypothetical protein